MENKPKFILEIQDKGIVFGIDLQVLQIQENGSDIVPGVVAVKLGAEAWYFKGNSL